MRYLEATIEDLPDVINLLQDDVFGKTRESIAKNDFSAYKKAFLAINKDPNNKLIVVKEKDKIVGTMQLGIERYCCRRMLLTTLETIQQVIPFYEAIHQRNLEIKSELE